MAHYRTSQSAAHSRTMTELKQHLPRGQVTRPNLMHFSVNRTRGRQQPGAGELLAATAYGNFFAEQGNSSSSTAAPSHRSVPDITLRTWGTRTTGFNHSSTLRRAGNSQSDTSLSATARAANLKAERCLSQWDLAAEHQAEMTRTGFSTGRMSGTDRSSKGFKRSSKGFGDVEQRAEAFRQDLDAVDSLLDSITRKRPIECRPEERKERERREAAARREADIREARKLEAEARDPHRKVDMRLENRRRFGPEGGASTEVPMMKVSFGGYNGVEQVELVDVRKIRARCRQIDEVCSVNSLLERQRQREWQEQLAVPTPKSTMKSSISAPALHNDSKGAPKISLSPRPNKCAATAGELFDSRAASAKVQKESLFLGKVLRRLKTMRSKPPEATLRNFEATFERNLEDRRQTQILEFRQTVNAEPPTPLRSPSRLSPANEELRKSPGKAGGRPSNRLLLKRDKSRMTVTKRSHRHWLLARFAASTFFLYRLILRKQHAKRVVVAFMRQLGEWSRLRVSMQSLVRNLKILQRSCRAFLATKRHRCEIVSKDWQRAEDHHLPLITRMFMEQALHEQVQEMAGAKTVVGAGGRQNKIALKLAMEKLEQSPIFKLKQQAMDNFDWRQLRIPQKERMHIIGKYYMVQMRRRVNGTKNLMAVVQTVVRSQRELVSFLQQFGAEEHQAADLAELTVGYQEPVQREFWRPSEETLFDLIAIAVKQLCLTSPFQEHPATRDHPRNPFYRRDLKVSADVVTMPRQSELADDIGKLGLGSLHSTAHTRQVRKPMPARVAIKARPRSKVDLDEVFGQFTPRLFQDQAMEKQISVGQAPASRIATRDSSRNTLLSRHKFGDSMQHFRPAGMSEPRDSFWKP